MFKGLICLSLETSAFECQRMLLFSLRWLNKYQLVCAPVYAYARKRVHTFSGTTTWTWWCPRETAGRCSVRYARCPATRWRCTASDCGSSGAARLRRRAAPRWSAPGTATASRLSTCFSTRVMSIGAFFTTATPTRRCPRRSCSRSLSVHSALSSSVCFRQKVFPMIRQSISWYSYNYADRRTLWHLKVASEPKAIYHVSAWEIFSLILPR